MDGLLQELTQDRQGRFCRSARTASWICAKGSTGAIRHDIGNIQSTIPGEVFENLVILGSATGEGYMSPPGDIRAYDVRTGRWCGRSTPWPRLVSSATTRGRRTPGSTSAARTTGRDDGGLRRGIAYVPLGSPTYDFYGADRIGANSSERRSSRSTRAPASACGTSSSCTTTCGTSIRARRRS
jgi:quinoprotein glucose dehydrogenase